MVFISSLLLREQQDLQATLATLPDVCEGLLPFGVDSPFFRRDLDAQDERLERMGKNLKEVARLGKAVCDANQSMTAAVQALAEEIESQRWEDCEFQHESPLSLGMSAPKRRYVCWRECDYCERAVVSES